MTLVVTFFMAPKISHIHMIFKFWLVSPNKTTTTTTNGDHVMAVFSNFGLNISRNKQMPNFFTPPMLIKKVSLER